MKLTKRIQQLYSLWGKKLIATSIALTVAASAAPIAASASSAVVQFKDTKNFWAAESIGWAVSQGIVKGYSDGTFRPNNKVTQAEFLSMLLRAFEVDGLQRQDNAAWDEPVWQYAKQMNWDLKDRYAAVNRGGVATIIGNALGYACSTNENIQLLYDYNLSNGKHSKTIEGYAANDGLTRAEAVVFLRNVKASVSDLKAKPASAAPACPALEDPNAEITPLKPQAQGNYKVSTTVTNQSKIILSGSFALERAVLVRITKGKTEEKEVYVSKGKKLEIPIFLRHGAGSYKVEIFEKDINASGSYKSVVWGDTAFTVTNKDTRDLKYLLPTQYAESDDPTIIALAEKITKGLTSDLKKTKAIHDWVAKNIAYDVKSYLGNDLVNYSAIDTLNRKEAICSGYVHLTAALNRSIGIKTRIINGTAIWAEDGETWSNTTKQDNHAWAEVLVGGRWVIQDPTWNAGYVDFDKQVFNFKYSEKYFNPTAQQFALTHRKTEESPF